MNAVLAGPYGHPLHPILVTVPIGAWVTSLVFDIASRLVGDPAFLARGALWLIAIGVIGALAAGAGTDSPAERHFPIAVVVAHGLFTVATVLLVLLAALGVAGS